MIKFSFKRVNSFSEWNISPIQGKQLLLPIPWADVTFESEWSSKIEDHF